MADNNQPQGALDQAVKTGTAAKPVIANESVLTQMEQLYKDKLARNQSFLQDMADASAWWSGGVEGPTRGLALRAQTRAAQEKELEDLAKNIASTKIGLGQLQEANQALQPAGDTTAPVTGGAQLPTGWSTYRGVPVPPEVSASIQSYLRVGDIAKANAVFQEYAKSRGSFLNTPSTYEQKPFWDESKGRTVQKMPYEVQQETLFGPRPAPAPAAAPAATTAPAPVAAPAPAAAPAPTTAATTQVADVYRFENLSEPQQTRLRNEFVRLNLQGNVEDLFNRSPMEKRKAAFETVGEKPVTTPTTAAPTTAPTTAPAPTTEAPRRFANKAEEDAFKKSQEEYAAGQASKAGQKVGENRAAFETAATDARQNLQNVNVMLNIIDTYPEAIGLSYKNKAMGMAIEFGKLFGKDLEPFARRTALSPEAIDAGKKFDALAQTNGLKFRQEVYKGTGQVSDFETKLSERAAGLSLDNSVGANRFFAIVAGENYRTLDKLGKAWAEYKNEKGALADFEKFKQSDVWRNAQNEREQRLKKLFPEIDSAEVGFGEKTKGGVPTQRMDELRDRYGINRAKP